MKQNNKYQIGRSWYKILRISLSTIVIASCGNNISNENAKSKKLYSRGHDEENNQTPNNDLNSKGKVSP